MTTAYILGSGPSLTTTLPLAAMRDNWLAEHRAAGGLVIGCNASIMRYWPAMTHYICVDTAAPEEWRDVALAQFKQERLWLFHYLADKWGARERATVWERRDGELWDRNFNGTLSCGYTVVYCACHMALTLGATRLVLVGVDLEHDQSTGCIHYNDEPTGTGETPGLGRMLDHWKRMRGALAAGACQYRVIEPGVQFDNASRSQIDGWRNIDPATLCE